MTAAPSTAACESSACSTLTEVMFASPEMVTSLLRSRLSSIDRTTLWMEFPVRATGSARAELRQKSTADVPNLDLDRAAARRCRLQRY